MRKMKSNSMTNHLDTTKTVAADSAKPETPNTRAVTHRADRPRAKAEPSEQHTPGPWCKARTSNGWSVGQSGTCVCVTEGPDDGVCEANALLIAAAPELLEACKKTKSFIDDLSKSNPGFLGKLVLQDYAQYNEAMIELPRAIAKAEGAALGEVEHEKD